MRPLVHGSRAGPNPVAAAAFFSSLPRPPPASAELAAAAVASASGFVPASPLRAPPRGATACGRARHRAPGPRRPARRLRAPPSRSPPARPPGGATGSAASARGARAVPGEEGEQRRRRRRGRARPPPPPPNTIGGSGTKMSNRVLCREASHAGSWYTASGTGAAARSAAGGGGRGLNQHFPPPAPRPGPGPVPAAGRGRRPRPRRRGRAHGGRGGSGGRGPPGSAERGGGGVCQARLAGGERPGEPVGRAGGTGEGVPPCIRWPSCAPRSAEQTGPARGPAPAQRHPSPGKPALDRGQGSVAPPGLSVRARPWFRAAHRCPSVPRGRGGGASPRVVPRPEYCT